ncbi:hypothetical protein BDR26DRAFT_1005975 [Obelidium mucronatum]|nr:hypothetical protein BDR26DRAFT_1005975 [Obelidium mucronatum]
MGVKSLWPLIRSLFPDAVADAASPSAALRACAASTGAAPTSSTLVHVLVDLNGLLHRASFARAAAAAAADGAISLAPSEDGVVATALRKVDRLVFGGKGRVRVASLFLALDGPPPLPKLVLQRTRRLGVSKKRRTTTDALRFNSLHFTPGSLFMTRLDASLSHYAASVVGRNPWLQHCIVSGSRVPGEGEVKIVEHIVNQRHSVDPAKSERNVNMLVTGDSDGIIQIMLASPSSTPTCLYNPDQHISFSLPPIQSSLQSLFPMFPKSSEFIIRIQQDLALLFILASGNDTCPGMPRVGIEYLWSAYIHVIGTQATTKGYTAIQDDTAKKSKGGKKATSAKKRSQQQQQAAEMEFLINVETGYLDLKVLESILLETQSRIRAGDATTPANETIALETNTKATSKVNDVEEISDLESDVDVQDDVAASPPQPPSSDTPLFEEIVGQYIDMVLWTVNSNSTGNTRDYRLAYDRVGGPSMRLTLDWLSRVDDINKKVYWKGPQSRLQDRKPLIPGLCAVAVIPPEDRNLIHSSFHPLTLQFADSLAKATEAIDKAHGIFPSVVPDSSAGHDQLVSDAIVPASESAPPAAREPPELRTTRKKTLLQSFTDLELEYNKLVVNNTNSTNNYDPAIQSFMPMIRVRHVPNVDSVKSVRDVDGSVGKRVESVKPVVPGAGGLAIKFLTWEPKAVTLAAASEKYSSHEGGLVFEVCESVGGGGKEDRQWVWLKDVDCILVERKGISEWHNLGLKMAASGAGGGGGGRIENSLPSGGNEVGGVL